MLFIYGWRKKDSAIVVLVLQEKVLTLWIEKAHWSTRRGSVRKIAPLPMRIELPSEARHLGSESSTREVGQSE